MDICIKELRVRNYKCYENVDVNLKDSNLLLGVNNVGKTSLLEALELCFTKYKRINEEIFFVKKGEVLSKEKSIILDILIESKEKEFSEKWLDLFGVLIFDEDEKQYVGIRTTIKYNFSRSNYEIDRRGMNSWPKTNEVENFDNFNTERITNDIVEAFPVFYLDAKRDIASEMGDKYSYFGRLIKDIKLSDENLEEMERHLN